MPRLIPPEKRRSGYSHALAGGVRTVHCYYRRTEAAPELAALRHTPQGCRKRRLAVCPPYIAPHLRLRCRKARSQRWAGYSRALARGARTDYHPRGTEAAPRCLLAWREAAWWCRGARSQRGAWCWMLALRRKAAAKSRHRMRVSRDAGANSRCQLLTRREAAWSNRQLLE